MNASLIASRWSLNQGWKDFFFLLFFFISHVKAWQNDFHHLGYSLFSFQSDGKKGNDIVAWSFFSFFLSVLFFWWEQKWAVHFKFITRATAWVYPLKPTGASRRHNCLNINDIITYGCKGPCRKGILRKREKKGKKRQNFYRISYGISMESDRDAFWIPWVELFCGTYPLFP